MELILLVILAVLLICSTFFHISVLYGLFLWLGILLTYAFCHGCTFSSLLPAILHKMKAVSGVLITFCLIGMLSAVLRSSGSILLILSLCRHLTSGKLVLPAAFLLCSFMSLCTGSAFASVASVGIICSSMGHMAGIPNLLLYGAVLSGIYVGDRISPVSSSAALVSDISGYHMNGNLHSMVSRFLLPYITTLLFYCILGLIYGSNQIHSTVQFQEVSWICVIPVVLILVLSYLKLNSRLILGSAILSGLLLTFLQTPIDLHTTFSLLFSGFCSSDPALSMLNGGGILSMLRPALVILIASCYVAIFEMTDFLAPIQNFLQHLTISRMEKSILVSVFTSMLAGSQTLTVILSSLLLKKNLEHKKLADTLEDTAILIPAMIPWSTAFSVPAAALSASALCIPFAFYLYMVPLYAWIMEKRPILAPAKNGTAKRSMA